MYAGDTTITIYGDDPDTVAAAAQAVVPAAPEDVPDLDQQVRVLNGSYLDAPATLPAPDAATLAQTEPCE